MQNFMLSLNVVIPSFIFIALGALLKGVKILNENAIEAMNKMSFKVFLPVLLFYSIYKTELASAFNGTLVLYCVSATLILFTLLMVIVPLLDKKKENRGVMVQCIYRSNFLLFGMPILTSLFGADNIGGVALTMGIVVALFNLTSVIALEVFKGEKISLKKIAKGIILNPLIIGTVLGIIFLLCKIQLPKFIEAPTKSISDLASPIALIVLGGAFRLSKIQGNIKQLIVGVVGKLLIVPLLVTGVAIAIGLRGIELATIWVFSAAPTAVASYTMAQQSGANSDLASEIIVFGAGLSVITMFCGVLILSSSGLLF